MNIQRLTLKTLALLAFAIGSVSCHTMHGVGQDIEHTGQAIENAAH